MIWCVWYPSGGFGHFVNSVISLHGVEFERPVKQQVKFSATGDSHSLDTVAPKYSHDPETYDFKFDNNKKYSVLIDNGINNEGKQFLRVFPHAKVIKMCYSDQSWPVIAQTMIVKAVKSTVDDQLPTSEWSHTAPWVTREKYFLFLRDHTLRHAWKPESNYNCIMIEDLVDYHCLKSKIEKTDIKLENFENLWTLWYQNNQRYFQPVFQAQQIVSQIQNQQSQNLRSITDVWTQAVIYYYIWMVYGIEVPHNDYKDFFESTDQIISWIGNNKVLI